MKRTILFFVTAAVLAGCSQPAPLAQRDPKGFEACSQLISSRNPNGTPVDSIAGVFGFMGEAASQSTTEAIRATAKPATGDAGLVNTATKTLIWDVDKDALAAACRAEGVDVPDAPAKS